MKNAWEEWRRAIGTQFVSWALGILPAPENLELAAAFLPLMQIWLQRMQAKGYEIHEK